jgi:hypothetical protein
MQILVKAIVPKKGQSFEKAAEAALVYAHKVVEPRMVKWSEKVVEGWSDPHTFESSSEVKGGDLVIFCEPVGAIAKKWRWVSFGVKARAIKATSAPFLVFPHSKSPAPGWQPKTKPAGGRVISGGPGTSSGHVVKTKVAWNWPGISPRNFEKVFANWSRLWFSKGVQDAINKAFK